MSWNVALMEPIPEEGGESAGPVGGTYFFGPTGFLLPGAVKKELYRSERIKSSSRTVPEDRLRNMDPSDEQYLEGLGPADLMSNAFSFSYESEIQPPVTAASAFEQLETLQTQKVTRVTKVTTTRTVEQIPVDVPSSGDHDSGELLPSVYGLSMSNGQPIDDEFALCRPGAPWFLEAGRDRVSLAWTPPETFAEAGLVTHFCVQCRRPELPLPACEMWQPAHEGYLDQCQVTICGLERGLYQFRVCAVNTSGIAVGAPSFPSDIINLSDASNVPLASVGIAYPPGRPQAYPLQEQCAVRLSWAPPIAQGLSGPAAGYRIEYRPIGGSHDWMIANDQLIFQNSYTVNGLRPDFDYEFRVLARLADGISEPSQTSGPVRIPGPGGDISYSLPSPSGSSPGLPPDPPSQPQVTEVDQDGVVLIWAPPPPQRRPILGYLVEMRQRGDINWRAASERLATGTQALLTDLRPNAQYEFRVLAKSKDGWSEPSESSPWTQLRPRSQQPGTARSPPSRPAPPEIVDAGPNWLQLCWAPVHSPLPVQGYQLEIRENDGPWLPVNPILTSQCTFTVADLLPGPQYQFRILAKNSIGYSAPSAPSPPIRLNPDAIFPPETLNGDLSHADHLHPDRAPHLQRSESWLVNSPADELRAAHESPPLTDADDSPPPLRRAPPSPHSQRDELSWRDPTLPEVLEYLQHQNEQMRSNALAYLQHLCYHDDAVKQKVRQLDGIPKIVRLLDSDSPEMRRFACGCLRNLSYGKQNDQNKTVIATCEGLPGLLRCALGSGTHSSHEHEQLLQEEATGALWNLSGFDQLHGELLDMAALPLCTHVINPAWVEPAVFRNATGTLRNLTSSANRDARHKLRCVKGLAVTLLQFVERQLEANQCDSKPCENVVCILRNLSYRIQEESDPNFDRHPPPAAGDSRSRSAPNSPKPGGVRKAKVKKKAKDDSSASSNSANSCEVPAEVVNSGAPHLWQPDVGLLYIQLLIAASNPDVLEAAAGALHNLAACYWQPAVQMRALIRTEKTLPVLVELLRYEVDKVVCAVAIALRNLALDPKNRELVGKHATDGLAAVLPLDVGEQRASDETVTAVLGVLYQTCMSNADFARLFHEHRGTSKLLALVRHRPPKPARLLRYASHVLAALWAHRELHDVFRRAGFKESDFQYRPDASAVHTPSDTLNRPISSRPGAPPRTPRPLSHLLQGSHEEQLQQMNGNSFGHSRAPAPAPAELVLQSAIEPVYAQVQKGPRGSATQPALPPLPPPSRLAGQPANDSWV